jgi:hypothetical protein
MIVLVLYMMVNGVLIEQGIRSENQKDYDTFPTMAACEAQAKRDHKELFDGHPQVVLRCEKR